MTDDEALRRRHKDALAAAFPGLLERCDWTPDRLRGFRDNALRDLLREVKASSPWHAARLEAVDPSEISADDLSSLPTMTKSDLMANWDRIVTDDRLSLSTTEAHYAALADGGPQYLLDKYQVAATGGTSGVRGIFAVGWDEAFLVWAVYTRWVARTGLKPPESFASVAASSPLHITRALTRTFAEGNGEVHYFPVSRPLDEIVAGLQQAQPQVLHGYPSALHLVANEARAGRLKISPASVVVSSEPLLPGTAALISEVWQCPLFNLWGTTEAGTLAMGCGRSRAMHLSEDLVIFEPVDRDGRPVPPGTRADKVLVTALFETTLPLIRYELDDEVEVLIDPCPCGSAMPLIADIQGRADESLDFGHGRVVHPHALRSVLARESAVLEYQVRQSDRGIDVDVRLASSVDVDSLRRHLAAALADLGVPDAEVRVQEVADLPRSDVGKVRRFVPLRSRQIRNGSSS